MCESLMLLLYITKKILELKNYLKGISVTVKYSGAVRFFSFKTKFTETVIIW